MSEVVKVAYIDMDGTLCTYDIEGDPADYVVFEDVEDKSLKFKEVKSVFGLTYIHKQTLSNLNKLKQSGVVLVGVTARDFHTGTRLNPTVLNLFDRIYTSFSLKCYDVHLDEHDKVFEEKVANIYLKDIERNNKKLDSILSSYGLSQRTIVPSRRDECVIYLDIQHMELELLEDLIDTLESEGLPTILFSKQNHLEIKLASSSKANSIIYDRKMRGKTFSICIGDSLADYEMLDACNLGIFPKRLTDAIWKTRSFSSIGSDVSKVTVLENDEFMKSNIKEAITAFAKADKNFLS